jgi:hypothetical protein
MSDNIFSHRAHGEEESDEEGGKRPVKKARHFIQKLALGTNIFVKASNMLKPFLCEEKKWKYSPKPFEFSWFRVIS